MRMIPVDTSQLSFLVGAEAEPKMDRENKTQRTDNNTGEMLFVVNLGVLLPGNQPMSSIQVTVAGKAPEVTKGTQVVPVELEAIPWNQGTRSGVAYRAKDIKPVTASASSKAAA